LVGLGFVEKLLYNILLLLIKELLLLLLPLSFNKGIPNFHHRATFITAAKTKAVIFSNKTLQHVEDI